MSSHCSKYPECGCPATVGHHCGKPYTVKEIQELNKGNMVEKNDGNGNTIAVDNPDRFNFVEGRRKKIRKKVTNYTKPKKKRRK